MGNDFSQPKVITTHKKIWISFDTTELHQEILLYLFTVHQLTQKCFMDHVFIGCKKQIEHICICKFNYSSIIKQNLQASEKKNPHMLQMHIPLDCVDLTYHSWDLLGCRTHQTTQGPSIPYLEGNEWGNGIALQRPNISCVSAHKPMRPLKFLPLHNNCIFLSTHHVPVFLCYLFFLCKVSHFLKLDISDLKWRGMIDGYLLSQHFFNQTFFVAGHKNNDPAMILTRVKKKLWLSTGIFHFCGRDLNKWMTEWMKLKNCFYKLRGMGKENLSAKDAVTNDTSITSQQWMIFEKIGPLGTYFHRLWRECERGPDRSVQTGKFLKWEPK